jgi:hypothetical protein
MQKKVVRIQEIEYGRQESEYREAKTEARITETGYSGK